MAKWLQDLFDDYMEEVLDEDVMSSSDTPVTIGGIYFGSLRSIDPSKPNKPLYFLIADKIDNELYEVFKVSDHYEFATNRDVLLDVSGMMVMVEVGNNFYLSKEEIQKFFLIHKVSEENLRDILLFRDGEEPSRPLRIGVTPIYEEDVRNKFHQAEFRMIEDLHLRVFALLQDLEEEPLEDPFDDSEDEWVEPIEEKWLYPRP